MSATEIDRTAILSPDEVYRYELTRTWDRDRPRLSWIMLNPSTADSLKDDPTIRRCVGFAQAWGFGGIRVRNLFALRATDPRELAQHVDPIGPDNDEHLLTAPDEPIVCAWGAHPFAVGRAAIVRLRLAQHDRELHHLGLTKTGAPRHPVRLPGSLTPERWAS